MVKPLTSRQPAIARYQLTLTWTANGSEDAATPSPATPIPVTVEQGEFVFHLDAIALESIQQAQTHPFTLSVPKGLLADLKYYSILEESPIGQGKFGLGKLRSSIHLQSGLTFQTCWYETGTAPQVQAHQPYQIKAARTIVSLDGDVLHQVCKDYLHHPQGAEILAAHCWLMNHLMQRFRSDIARYLDWIVWAVPTLSVGGSLVSNVSGLTNPATTPQAMVGIALSLSSFVAPVLWYWLREQALSILLPALQRWTWQQLLNPNSPFQKLAKLALRT